MPRPPGLGNHLRHVVDLPLRAAVRAEAFLGQLAGPLVFAVAQEFDHAAFVGCETMFRCVSRGLGGNDGVRGGGVCDFGGQAWIVGGIDVVV